MARQSAGCGWALAGLFFILWAGNFLRGCGGAPQAPSPHSITREDVLGGLKQQSLEDLKRQVIALDKVETREHKARKKEPWRAR